MLIKVLAVLTVKFCPVSSSVPHSDLLIPVSDKMQIRVLLHKLNYFFECFCVSATDRDAQKYGSVRF